MKKSDLKSGMIIELRDYSRFLVVTKTDAVSRGSCIHLDDYNENLLNVDYRFRDVMKIYNPELGYLRAPEHFNKLTEEDLIWFRKPTKLDKLREALKNISGMSDEELNDVLIYFGVELGDEE